MQVNNQRMVQSIALLETGRQEEGMEDTQRKVVLEAIVQKLRGAGQRAVICEVNMPIPNVWREPNHSQPEEMDIAWVFKTDDRGSLQRIKLDVNTSQQNILCASFDASDGKLMMVRFSDPVLGHLSLLYNENRELIKDPNCPEEEATDSWQEELGKGRLDSFLIDFCRLQEIDIGASRVR